ncbi:MAG: ATPase [Bacteroidetes bacterium]|nr:MAG: ATPase [Bacteroidota bacterium]
MSPYNFIIKPRDKALSFDDIHFSKKNKAVLDQFLSEFKHREALQTYDLQVDNKILMFGHTGCGKTAAARAIADRLGKKIIILDLGNVVSSRLGETAKNITAIFSKASREYSVLFIDEFDAIGIIRNHDQKESGEMRRLVNSIIQSIDNLSSNTLFIAATNNKDAIDSALLRRFQLKLKFELPIQEELDNYYNSLLKKYPREFRDIKRVYNISFAEAKDITLRFIKLKVIDSEEVRLKNIVG